MSVIKRLKKLLTIPLIWILFAVSALNLPVLVNNVYAVPDDPSAAPAAVENAGGDAENAAEDSEDTEENTGENGEDPENSGEAGTQSGGSSTATTCSSQIGALGWLLCPATGVLAKAIDAIYGTIEDLLVVEPVEMKAGSPTFVVWTYMRNIANIVFVFMFIAIIYSQITGFGISNYGIKAMLPKLVISAVLMNLSFIICSLLVDASNILGAGLRDLLTSVGETAVANGVINAGSVNFSISDLFAAIAGTGTIAGIAIVANGGLVDSLLALIPVVLGVFISVMVGLITIAMRQAVVMLLVMISPLAFICYLLPNTEKWFGKWKDIMSQMLVFYPMFSLLFGASRLAGWVIISSAKGAFGIILGVAVQMMPLFLSLSLMRMSKSVLGGVSSRLAAFGARGQARAGSMVNDYRNLRRAQRVSKGLRQPFNPLSAASWSALGVKRQEDLKERLKNAESQKNSLLSERRSARLKGERIIGYDKEGRPIYSQRPVTTNRYMKEEYQARVDDLRSKAKALDTENALGEMGSYLDEQNIRDAKFRRLASQQGDNYLELRTQQSASARNDRADTRFYYNTVRDASKRLDDGSLANKDAYRKYVVRGAGVDAYRVSNLKNSKAFNDSTTTVVADAYDMYERERKTTIDKYTTYYGKQVTKEVLNNYEAMLSDDNIDGIVAAQSILAQRGDYDKIGSHLREYMDSGKVDLTSDEANVLALNLLAMKDKDPMLGRLGKFINMETWAYTDGRRKTKEVTYKQYVTGKVEGEYDANGNEVKTKVKLATALQGTSFKNIDRTALADLQQIMEYYTASGDFSEDDRRELMNEIRPAIVSAVPTFDSGSEAILNTVGFVTGLKFNNDKHDWADPNSKSTDPASISKDRFSYDQTVAYLSALTADNVVGMKTDMVNGIMQRLTAEHMNEAKRLHPGDPKKAKETARELAKQEIRDIFGERSYTNAYGETVKTGNGNIRKLLEGDKSALNSMKNSWRAILGI